jgi:hypothetical protein
MQTLPIRYEKRYELPYFSEISTGGSRQLFPSLNALIFGQVYDDRELIEEGCQELAVELEETHGALASCLISMVE